MAADPTQKTPSVILKESKDCDAVINKSPSAKAGSASNIPNFRPLTRNSSQQVHAFQSNFYSPGTAFVVLVPPTSILGREVTVFSTAFVGHVADKIFQHVRFI